MDLIQRFQQSLTEYNKAKSLIDKGEIDNAENLLKNALSLYPREILMGNDPGLDGVVRESYETLFTDISVQLEVIRSLREDNIYSAAPAPMPAPVQPLESLEDVEDEEEEALEPEPPAQPISSGSFTSLQDIVRRNMQRSGTAPPAGDDMFATPAGDDLASADEEPAGRDLPRELSDEEEETLIQETLEEEFLSAEEQIEDSEDESEYKTDDHGFEMPDDQMEHDEEPEMELPEPQAAADGEELAVELPTDPTAEPVAEDNEIGDLLNAAEAAFDEEESEPSAAPAVDLEEQTIELPADPTAEPADEDDGGIGDLLNAAESAIDDEEDTDGTDSPEPSEEEELSANELLDDIAAAEETAVDDSEKPAEEEDDAGIEEEGDVQVEQEPEQKQGESTSGDEIDDLLSAAEESMDDGGGDSAPAPAARPAPSGGTEEVLDDNEEVLDDNEEVLEEGSDGEEEALISDEELQKQKSPKKKKKKKKRRAPGAGAAAAMNLILALLAIASLAGGGYLAYDTMQKGMALQQAFSAADQAADTGNTEALTKQSTEYFKAAGASAGPNSAAITASWSQALADGNQQDKAAAVLAEQLSRTPNSMSTAEQLVELLLDKLEKAKEAGNTEAAVKTARRIANVMNTYKVSPAKRQTFMRRLTAGSCRIQQLSIVASIEGGDPLGAYDKLVEVQKMRQYMNAEEQDDIDGMKLNVSRALDAKAAESLKAGDAKAAVEMAGKALHLNPGLKSAARTKTLAERKLK